VSISGCTVHIVTADLDAGPILAQAAVPVLPADTHASLSGRVQKQEHVLLPATLQQYAHRWRQG
jgi:phosphoribosylglycinamide formyltransferase-1